MALVSADTVDVARVRYGGFGHRQKTKAGTQLSSIADPPDQYGVLAEAVRLREVGYLTRWEYKANLLPVFRFLRGFKKTKTGARCEVWPQRMRRYSRMPALGRRSR